MSGSNDEISRIAERIVNHPAFVNRVNQLTSPSTENSPRRNFSSPRDEISNLFRRSRSRTPHTPHERTRSVRNSITFKEVVFLTDDQKYTIRGGQKKADLLEKGISNLSLML